MRQLVLPRSQPILDLALSPDGQTIAVAYRNVGLALYDPFDGRVKLEFRGYYSRLQFRGDGQWLVAATPGAVVVSLAAERPREVHFHFNEFIYHIAFAPDDALTVLGFNALRTVRLPGEQETPGFNLGSFVLNERPLNRRAQSHLLYAFGLGPTDQVLGFETGTSVQNFVPVVVDSAGRPLAIVEAPAGFALNPNAPHFRHHGDWFALSTKRELALYNWADLATLAPPPPREPHRRGLFQTLRETLLGPSRFTLHEQRYGSLPTLRPRWRLPAIGQPPTDPLPIAFLPDGSGFLCRGTNAAIELRDTATGQVRTAWQFQRAWPRVLAVAPDGLTAIAAAKGGIVTFWDLE